MTLLRSATYLVATLKRKFLTLLRTWAQRIWPRSKPVDGPELEELIPDLVMLYRSQGKQDVMRIVHAMQLQPMGSNQQVIPDLRNR